MAFQDLPSKHRRCAVVATLLAVIALLPARVALAEEECVDPDDSQLSGITLHWTLVHEVALGIAPADNLTIRQFRSTETTGCSGTGDPMNALRLQIEQNGAILYQYESDLKSRDFWLKHTFELRDVMGLGAPQVVFDSGQMGASDWIAHEHIVPLINDYRFSDVGLPAFDSSWRHTIGWFQAGSRHFVVVSIPIIGDPEADPDGFCHSCPHPYKYVVYQWQFADAQWKVVKEIPSSGRFEDDPLVPDRQYIQDRLP